MPGCFLRDRIGGSLGARVRGTKPWQSRTRGETQRAMDPRLGGSFPWFALGSLARPVTVGALAGRRGAAMPSPKTMRFGCS